MRWIAAIFLTIGWWAAGAALAQQPAERPSPFAPIESPNVDPDTFTKPQAAPPAGADKLNPGTNAPALAIPKSVDLGKSRLDFDVSHTSTITAPGVAIDSGETANLSKTLPGQKQETTLPNYFGLRISTPTH